MTKKSIFEKLGFIENVESIESNIDIPLKNYDDKNENLELEKVIDFGGDLILPEEIYNESNYHNDNNIFKIQQYKDAFPNSMSNEMKKQSILGALNVNNLNVEDLIEDGNKRIAIIEQNIQSLKNETDEYINILNNEIEELLKQVDNNKNDIDNKKVYMSKQYEILENEINTIKEIIKFIS